MPEGTTDINVMEAGWPYVDEAKIVVYGAIDPVPNILEKLDALEATLEAASKKDFRNRAFKELLIRQIEAVEWLVKRGWYGLALRTLQKELLPETDACYVKPARHSNDLIADCDLQKQVYWSLNEVSVLLNIAKAGRRGLTAALLPPPPALRQACPNVPRADASLIAVRSLHRQRGQPHLPVAPVVSTIERRV